MNVIKQLSHWLHPDAEPASADVATQSSHLLASLLTMAWFVEARDPYTGGHLWRVSRYARLLAERAGFNNADAARIGLGGFLHDLGKVGVPDAILRKTDRLTDEEYAVIKTHPTIGMRMLSGHPLAQLVSDAVLLHHERPDGLGYPRGLSGDVIPDMARIVGICDAFDAMTSHRPYRSGMPRDKAIAILRQYRGTQFDTHYADIFIALGEAGELNHVMGHSDESIPLQSCPMCGPTLVITRENNEGDHLYCRNCSGGFTLEKQDAGLVAVPTGRQGQAVDLEPEVDSALIARTVRAAVEALPIADLMKAASMPVGAAR
ncbi:HD-GYP domain-containing protein [Herminiimonas fonticola]|uniref:HD domain-containing protein n=1 Tax=Herminiimonas fonticola TaxID=303380 RepID=A0A4R6FZP8_9BURK|nr:HD-GYP domain-containing protein [Herminiimonas fonticola]RBA23592.1 HD domain [Herminiimonas fonticola]TDN87472.1 HD domain-containing protein [Herminiimonas fonticola]